MFSAGIRIVGLISEEQIFCILLCMYAFLVGIPDVFWQIAKNTSASRISEIKKSQNRQQPMNWLWRRKAHRPTPYAPDGNRLGEHFSVRQDGQTATVSARNKQVHVQPENQVQVIKTVDRYICHLSGQREVRGYVD